MRNIILVVAHLHFLLGDGFSVVIDRNGGAYPVYSGITGNFTEISEMKNSSVHEESVGVAEHSNREGFYPGTEFDGMTNAADEEAENFNGKTNGSFIDYGNVTAGLLMAQYERCLHSKGFLDCLKFKSFKFLKDLFEPITSNNISDIVRSQPVNNRNEPLLIGLPPPPNGTTQSVLVKTMHRAFGSSRSMELIQFLVEQLDSFVSRHGFMITVKNVQGDQPVQLDSPWLIDFEHSREKRSAIGTGRKVKKKEYAIVFPMLVLFKFLKIKMLLVPILLGVIFLKKLLILTLTLLPYLIGLFGCCRRPPFFGPVQAAGLLQEVDTRGEFSSNLGYSFPYREGFSFRQKDRGRPSDAYSDY